MNLVISECYWPDAILGGLFDVLFYEVPFDIRPSSSTKYSMLQILEVI